MNKKFNLNNSGDLASRVLKQFLNPSGASLAKSSNAQDELDDLIEPSGADSNMQAQPSN